MSLENIKIGDFDICGNAYIQCQNCTHAMPTLSAGIIECAEKQESRAAVGQYRWWDTLDHVCGKFEKKQ